MKNEKVIRLLQVKVLPQYRDEILNAALENKLPTRAEEGVEAYYQTTRKDDPNTILFFAVFSSQAAYDSHVQTEHAKRTFAAFQGKLAEEPVRAELIELAD
jgi:quinol monooxygenase YgiN